MSFILDALRKSEHERQRQTGPTLVEAAVAAPRARTNPWATAAIALLLLNLVALGVFLLVKSRSRDEPPAAPVADSAPASAPVPAAGTPPPAGGATQQASVTRTLPPGVSSAQPPPMLRPAAPEPTPASRNPLEREVYGDAPAMSAEAAARAAAPPGGPPAVVATPSRGGSVVYETLPGTDPASAGSRGSETGDLPRADEVAARTGLPELRLELHVYSNRPQERFVFINAHKYREGETTQEGASIVEITPDGVVMSSGGKRFLLPRD
jgi:general secretion pathway protein B